MSSIVRGVILASGLGVTKALAKNVAAKYVLDYLDKNGLPGRRD